MSAEALAKAEVRRPSAAFGGGKAPMNPRGPNACLAEIGVEMLEAHLQHVFRTSWEPAFLALFQPMKRQLKIASLLLLVLSVLLCSCITRGRKFSFNNFDQLVLGKVKSTEYQALFGQPLNASIETSVEGKFEYARYQYLEQSTSGYFLQKTLILEFKDGVLNAYIRASSFKGEGPKIDANKVDRVRAAIGKESREDVLAVLGVPDGKAHCPSKLGDFKERCERAAEVWAWLPLNKFDYRSKTNTDWSVFVLFDNDGKVADVQTRTSTRH